MISFDRAICATSKKHVNLTFSTPSDSLSREVFGVLGMPVDALDLSTSGR